VLSNSSGTTSPISLAGNTSSVFCTYPAEKSINYDANGVATIGEVLGYSDTGIIGSFASTVAGYNQVIVQNKSTAANASANFNVSNDAGTSGNNYAELGINSSTYTGTGSFNIAGASYVASASTDLTLGTYGAYNIHFVTNSNTTDAMTIYNDGGISLGTFANPGLGNMAASKFVPGYSAVTSAAGTTVLTDDSNYYQNLVGSTTQTFQLPDATTLLDGTTFIFDNNSTGVLTIVDNASGSVDTLPSGAAGFVYLANNSTVAGSWNRHSFLPVTYDFNATTANFGGATITNALWNGTTIATGYGGTGLTTFAAANNALYSTSSSALAAGTLPIQAGGTAATTFTANGVLYGNGTSALGVTAAGTTGQVLLANTSGAPTWGSVPSTGAVTSFQTSLSGLTPSTATTGAVTLAGTLGPTSGGTGSSTAFTTGSVVFAGASGTYTEDNANFFWDDTNNRLGIGTASPTAPLSIYGASTATLQVTTDGTIANIISARYSTNTGSAAITVRKGRGTLASPTAVASADQLGQLIFQGYGGTNIRSLANILGLVETYTSDTDISSALTFSTSPSGSTTATERMRINSSGNVGIGTTSPTERLNVTGTIHATGAGGFPTTGVGIEIVPSVAGGDNYVQAYSRTASSWQKLNINALQTVFGTNGTERMRIDSSGNVGIGTATPNYRGSAAGTFLAVAGTSAAGGVLELVNTNADATGNYSTVAFIANGNTLAGNKSIAQVEAYTTGSTANNRGGQLAFITKADGGAALERMSITSAGFVGIGTTSPDTKLTIAGGGGAVIKILDGGDIQINNAANTGTTTLYCDTDQVLNVAGSIVASGTISSSSVAFDQIGTYAWLAYAAVSTATIVAGTNYAGSGLRPFGYTGTSTGAASGGTLPATTPSGTWKAMGNVATTTSLIKHTLYLRVA
jgi:hypothetical protein